MEALLDSIRVAVADGATDDERTRGAAACRALADILAPPTTAAPSVAIGTTAPTDLAVPSTITAPLRPAAPVAPGGNPLAGLTPDQILELVLAKLRHSAGPAAPAVPAGHPFQLVLVPVPRVAR